MQKQTFRVVVSVAYFEEVEGARHAAQPVPHVEGGLEAGDDALEQVQHALVHFQPDFLRQIDIVVNCVCFKTFNFLKYLN